MFIIKIYNKRLTVLRETEIKSKNIVLSNCSHKRSLGKQTKSSYYRQIRKNEKKFHNLLLEDDKCVFITLTTRDECTEKELNKKFRSFYRSIKRLDNDVEYIKTLDWFKDYKKLHLNILIQFPNGIPNINGKKFGKNWVLEHWKHTSSKTINVQYTHNAWSVLDYMLNPKFENALDEEENFVKFTKYTRIVTCSNNLRYEIPSECFSVKTFEEVSTVVKDFIRQFKEKYGITPFKRSFYANWIENNSLCSKLEYCNIHS